MKPRRFRPHVVASAATCLCIALAVVLAGCGGGGGGSQASSGTGAVGTAAGALAASAPQALPEATGTVVVVHQVTKSVVPSAVTDLEFTGLAEDGSVRYGPVRKPKAAQITLTGVPVSVTRIRVLYYCGDESVGEAYLSVWIPSGEATQAPAPDWADVTLVPPDYPSPSPSPTPAPLPFSVERVSSTADGSAGASNSDHASISGDGRFVAFVTRAGNLAHGDSSDGQYRFVLRDRLTGLTERLRVSTMLPAYPLALDLNIAIAHDGNSAAVIDDSHLLYYDLATKNVEEWLSRPTQPAVSPSISAGGRFVTFTSPARDLAPGGFQGLFNVFVRDRKTETTQMVSVTSAGAPMNEGAVSYLRSTSPNGRYITLASWNLHLHDRKTRLTTMVDVARDGTPAKQAPGVGAQTSDDGRFVCFQSGSDNLVDGDTNRQADIFVRDVLAGWTQRVSISSEGAQADDISYHLGMSGDARFVVFASRATNLVPGPLPSGASQVYVHDRSTGRTARVSRNLNGDPGDGSSEFPTISLDGRYIAFTSKARNLASGNDTNGMEDVFVASNPLLAP